MFFLEAQGGKSFICPSKLPGITCIPWLMAPVSFCKAYHHSNLLCPHICSLTPTSTYKACYDCTEPTCIIQDNGPISRSLADLPCKVTYLQSLRIRTWSSWGKGRLFTYNRALFHYVFNIIWFPRNVNRLGFDWQCQKVILRRERILSPRVLPSLLYKIMLFMTLVPKCLRSVI